MNFFPKNTYYANQFWIATRFFESIVLVSGFFFLTKKTKISYGFLLLVYSLITVIIILLILYWKIFPVCYIHGVGQTKFKIYSEYIIIFVLCCALYFLIRRKKYFQNEVFNYLLLSVISTIVSEFCFTLYFSNTGLFNEIGHIFKIFSFYFIYKAVIETGFIKPGELLYRNLKISREKADLYNKQLEQEIATRDKLFSIIAHDLRSPFAVLLAGSEMLYKNPKMFDEEEMQKHHKLLYRASKNTFELLENLLDWTKMKAGIADPYPQSLDLNKLIKNQISFFKEPSDFKNITIQFSDNKICEANGDRLMIDTVLRNLISNAIKFTPKHGRICVSANMADDKVIVTVEDTGIGIKKKDIGKLFNPDITWTTRGTDNEKGSGLGLQLCKEFIMKNGGEIWVESEEGKGSRFSFSLNCN